MKAIAALLLAATALTAQMPAAFAATVLEKSDPAAGASIHKVEKITLRFSGTLQPALSGAQLRDKTGHELPVATAVGMTAITLLPFQLKPGAYHVDWHSVGQDKSKAKGSIAFTVTP